MSTITKQVFNESVEFVVLGHLIGASAIHFAIKDKIVAPVISNINTALNSNKDIYNILKKNFIDLYEAASARREFLPDAFLETIKICALIVLKHDNTVKLSCLNWLPQGELLEEHLNLFESFKIEFLTRINGTSKPEYK